MNSMVRMSSSKSKFGKYPTFRQDKVGLGHRDRQDKRPSLSVSTR